jgi:ABC-type multidrug transport system ATPase subunit
VRETEAPSALAAGRQEFFHHDGRGGGRNRARAGATDGMIELASVTRTYGTRARPVHALRDVSLSLGAGVQAVVGPNGAGKTTLLGLALGFLRPTAGSVRIEGLPPRRWLRRHGAAYLPERFRLPPEWPVRSALEALARLEGASRADAAGRADAAIAKLGLEDDADRPVGALSRGRYQRVGLAQALLAERAVVVLDEPTEGLDPLWRVRFREIVDELRGGGRTVVLASHDLAEVERMADRVVLLDRGRVRDILDIRPPAGGPLRYRIELAETGTAVDAAFPDAERAGGALIATVADHRELSHRLAALLEGGAVLRAVAPAEGGLEERVRSRLEEPS